jgi:hypothetical protein
MGWEDAMTVQLENGNRVQIPQEWIEEIGFGAEAEIVRSGKGVLILPKTDSPGRKVTWDDLPSLRVRAGVLPAEGDDWELTGDDYLF